MCEESSLKTLYLIRQITITGSAAYQLKYTTDNASQTDISTRDVQWKYGGSVWYQEPGHQLQKCGRRPSLAGQPLHGLPKMQGHSVRQSGDKAC